MTTIYIPTTQCIGLATMASYLSKYFKTEVIAVEEKSTWYIKYIYMVQFVQPLPENLLADLWKHGEYWFWPEPTRLLRIYFDEPNEIPPKDFISQYRYLVASCDNYYRLLNHTDTTCYIEDKQTYRKIPISENPFAF